MKNKFLFALTLVLLSSASNLYAREIDTNTAKLQAMNKLTGKVSVLEAPVNGEVKFGSFSIVVRACKTRPPEETPDNFAFVDVVDKHEDGSEVNIFKGWMVSSSPALHAVAHPIYDVWLLQCENTQVDTSKLLSAEELAARDEIVMAEQLPEQSNLLSENADISQELLLTIFFPKTPLHDGAVVIRENKIIAAGVLLPLTEDPKLSWRYGTRHRAAIGVSEVYPDCACIVVSEETGDVSVAIDGILKKYEDLGKLKADLIRILGYKQEEKNTHEKSFIKFDNIFGKNQ